MKNNNFFELIDTELKAYLLGFIFADGSISVRRNDSEKCLSITVTESDSDILELFKQQINTDVNFYYIPSKQNGVYIDNPKVKVSFYNKKLVDDLIKLGCVPNKTYLDIKIPSINEELIIHFIRGYFDGDGTCCANLVKEHDKRDGKTRYRQKLVFQIVCKTRSILVDMSNFLTKNNVDMHVYYMKTRDCFYLKCNSRSGINSIYNLFYSNASFFYKRKKLKFEEAMLTPREFRALKGFESCNA